MQIAKISSNLTKPGRRCQSIDSPDWLKLFRTSGRFTQYSTVRKEFWGWQIGALRPS